MMVELHLKKEKIFSEGKILNSQLRIEQDRFETSVNSRMSTERVFVEALCQLKMKLML